MSKAKPHYISYMLRLWQVTEQDKARWRASLENPHTGEQHGFASVEMLFEFVRQKIGAAHSAIEGGKNDREREDFEIG